MWVQYTVMLYRHDKVLTLAQLLVTRGVTAAAPEPRYTLYQLQKWWDLYLPETCRTFITESPRPDPVFIV